MAILISASSGVSHLIGLFLELHASLAAGTQKILAAILILGISVGLWLHHWQQFKGNLAESPLIPVKTRKKLT